MKTMKKVLSCLMAGLTLFSCVACAVETPASESSGSINYTDADIEFWTAPNTEKIMQDQYDIYSGIKGEDSIEIVAVKNEYENAQLIMTALTDIVSYDVSISNLRQANGEVISSENIVVYNQKYLEVSRITTGQDVPAGWYPDALVEFSRAKKAKENFIEKGENQGLWVTVYIPADAEAGLYTGEVTVTYGDVVHRTPMSVYVYDYVLSEEMHQQSCFLINWPYENGELNDTKDIFEVYRDMMLDYRLSTEVKSFYLTSLEAFVDEACEYMQQPKRPSVMLPFSPGDEGFDKASMLEYLRAFIDRSIEDNFNYLAQCFAYFNTMIDEPQVDNPTQIELVHRINDTWILMRQELAAELRANTTFMANALAEEIIDTVEKLPHIIVGSNGCTDEYNDVDAIWCPAVDSYWWNKETYDQQDVRWWYTFLWPKPPYPSYHIEDSLMSSRLMSWMQYDYGVVGNVYWAVNYYSNFDQVDGKYSVEDYYAMFNPNGPSNGDGWLVYPGAKYGIEGPIPTIRLMSIRDGLEEYEILYHLGSKYEELSEVLGADYNLNDYLYNYVQYLYSGVKVFTSAEIFIKVRQAVLNLCAIANGDSAFVLDFAKDTNTYTLVAKDGIEIKKGEEVLSASDTFEWNGQSYKLYTVTITNNQIELLSTTVNGVTAVLNIEFVGDLLTFTHEDMDTTWFSTSSGTISEDSFFTHSLYKVQLNDMPNNKTQAVNFVNKDVLNKLNKQAGQLTFNIYSMSEVKLSVKFKYANQEVLYEVATMNLKFGQNEVAIGGLYAFNWAGLGNVEYITFSFGEKGDKARTVYFGDISLSTVNF